MSTQWLQKSFIAFSQYRYRRWLMVGVSLGCLGLGLVFSLVDPPQAVAQTPSAQAHGTEHLTKTCFQLLEEAQYQPMLATCTEAVEAAKIEGNRRAETYALINLASAYGTLGQYARSIDTAQQSLHLTQALGDRQGEAYALINLANAFESMGQHAEAVGHAEQALSLIQALEEAYGTSEALRQSEAYALVNLSSAHWALNQYPQAILYAEKSLPLVRSLGDRQAEACALINLSSSYSASNQPTKAIDYAQQALVLTRATDNRRGEALALNNLGYAHYSNDQLTLADTYLRQSIEVFESLRPMLLDPEKLSLFETLTNPYHTLQRVLVAQGRAAEALEIAERGRARALVDRLAQRFSADQAGAVAPITLAEIQQVARDQQATLVEYALVTPTQLYSWVVSPMGHITFRPIDLSLQPGLEPLIVATHPDQTQLATVTDTSHSLRQLYQLLIAPIQDLLPTHPEDPIILVPQGSLFLVPFAALQTPEDSYLIEHHTLRLAPSIQVLQITRRHPRRQASIQTALVVGNPTNDLPAAEQEAKAIARLFSTSPLLGKQATKTAVVKKMPQAHLIHIAAHGAPNELEEPYGGLMVLAGSDQSFSTLTAAEIATMQLQAELVVLSGCNTGVSDIINSDGVVGLARSMMAAGVPSVMMSLWPVADAPTKALMRSFYQHWQPGALPQTQIWGLCAMMGVLGAGGVWLKPLQLGRANCQTSCQKAIANYLLIGLLGLTLAIAIGLNQPVQPSSPSLDKAQALRQAMLATLQTHPDPQNWAAFTLMGEAE